MHKIIILSIALFAISLSISCSSGSGILPDTSADSDRLVTSGRTVDDLGVAVSPQTLRLLTPQGGSVVVHTSIPIGLVNKTSLTLNGVAVKSTKADLQGNIVGYFDEFAIKAVVTPPQEKMELKGLYLTGEEFAGYDTVKVINK